MLSFMKRPLPSLKTPAPTLLVRAGEAAPEGASPSLDEARAIHLALRATGLNAFTAIAPAAGGDRAVAAALWLEALRLVAIPVGSFMMGSPATGPDRDAWEGPQHPVTLATPFQMGATPITAGAWETLMGENPSKSGRTLDTPVDWVSWDDITGIGGFLSRLNALTEGGRPEGTAFRLPSEAEWEYACRAGSTTAYCFGDDPAGLPDFGWIPTREDFFSRDVGQRRPNAWGLYDMHGNVAEWCQDVWHDSHDGAPADGRAWDDVREVDPQRTGMVRYVTRGGSDFGDAQPGAHSARRRRHLGGSSSSSLGFRVVCAPT
jgi:formylglycine-generating enzyme required for sulfatase activity